jgi:hypothetical protein
MALAGGIVLNGGIYVERRIGSLCASEVLRVEVRPELRLEYMRHGSACGESESAFSVSEWKTLRTMKERSCGDERMISPWRFSSRNKGYTDIRVEWG